MMTLPTTAAVAVENALISGDLKNLGPTDQLAYYRAVCESLGLNYLTKPFDYIVLNNKLVLYPNGDCAEQLRKIHRVSITKTERQMMDDLYIVTAYGETPDGRRDEAIGAVSIGKLQGADKANALMKAETKAKRRLTLSICGLNSPDLPEERLSSYKYDEELDGPREPVHLSEWREELDDDSPVVDVETGEIVEPPAPEGYIAPPPRVVVPSKENGSVLKDTPYQTQRKQLAIGAGALEHYRQIRNLALENQWALGDTGDVNDYRLSAAIWHGGFHSDAVTRTNWQDALTALRRHYEAKILAQAA
jgi:hypothetical protein